MKALLIAYYFPPIGGAGAQRPAKFVRYLPMFDVDPIVITGPGASVGRWTPADETLSAEIGPSITVKRVSGDEPPGASGWRRRGERWLRIPPEWSRWWTQGVFDLGREIEDVEIVYSWMSPYESAAAAQRLSAELGRPWVADLGDPWALDEMMVFPSALHRLVELQRMRRLLSSAAAIVMSTPEAATRVRHAFPELSGKPILSIPNGFDASDFEAPVPERNDGAFRIVHTGYLHTELGRRQRRTSVMRRLLGGETRGVDILTRSHIYLLEGIDGLIRQDPTLRDRIEVHLAGVLSSADREIAARSEVTRLHGYLPHAESIQLIRSADLLFLPMQNLPPGTRSSTVPGKTYEYLASGRPILAAVPEGDARDILTAGGSASVCRPNDVDAMRVILADRLDSRRDERGGVDEITSRFEYRHLTRSLADVFEDVLAVHETRARRRAAQHLASAVGRDQASRRTPKNALHLAYYFPPIGGAGAQRSLKFVRYLPQFGYRSVVITGSGETRGRWTPPDETLNAEVPSDTAVLRLAGPEPATSRGWKGRAERWLATLTEWSRWWIEGAEELGRDVRDADVILASMSPYEAADVAVRLSRELRRPWVAGLRDPWALDEMMVFPTALHRWLELRRMKRLLSSAAAIVLTTPEAAARVRHALPEFAGKPIVSIPNGFDASDFEDGVPERDDGVFRIVHTGYLHTELGRSQRQAAALRRLLGGATRGVDILTRSHVYLLAAIDRLIERDPGMSGRIEVHLAGVLSTVDRHIAAGSEVVRLRGYLSHAESIRLIRSADLLFLPMQNLPPGTRSSTVPGKTYEYLASGRPILGAVPEGDARDILTAAGNCRLTAPDDTTGMVDAISAEIDRWRAGIDSAPPAPDVVERYERRFLTAELAALLDAVAALSSAPGQNGSSRYPAQQAAEAVVPETYAT